MSQYTAKHHEMYRQTVVKLWYPLPLQKKVGTYIANFNFRFYKSTLQCIFFYGASYFSHVVFLCCHAPVSRLLDLWVQCLSRGHFNTWSEAVDLALPPEPHKLPQCGDHICVHDHTACARVHDSAAISLWSNGIWGLWEMERSVCGSQAVSVPDKGGGLSPGWLLHL